MVGIEVAEESNVLNADFDKYFKNIKFHLMVAVQRIDDLVLITIILIIIGRE